MLEDTRAQLAESTRKRAKQGTASVRQELGEAVLDATDEYFPEETRKRRRRDVGRGFLVGLAVGVLLRDALRW